MLTMFVLFVNKKHQNQIFIILAILRRSEQRVEGSILRILASGAAQLRRNVAAVADTVPI